VHQIKLFVDVESNLEAMEQKINQWLAGSGAKVVSVFGNIAPQTVTPDTKGSSLGVRRFSSSDVLIAIVYQSA